MPQAPESLHQMCQQRVVQINMELNVLCVKETLDDSANSRLFFFILQCSSLRSCNIWICHNLKCEQWINT